MPATPGEQQVAYYRAQAAEYEATSYRDVHRAGRRLTRPIWRRKGVLRMQSIGDNGVTGGSWRPLGHRDEHELQREVRDYLTSEVIGLVGGLGTQRQD